MASQGGRVTGLHGVSLSLGVGPTRIYGGGDGHEEPWAPRRLGVGERRERRDEDGRRGGGRAVRAVALVVVVARVVVAGRIVVVLRAELRAAAGARRREGARVGRLAPDTRGPSTRRSPFLIYTSPALSSPRGDAARPQLIVDGQPFFLPSAIRRRDRTPPILMDLD